MNKKILVICLVVVVVPLAGCDGGTQPWSLTVGGDLTELDGQYKYDAEIELGGSPTNVSLTGVRVEYLDANESRFGSDFIGNLSGYTLHEFTRNLTEKPAYISVKVDSIENPTGANYQIEGAVVTEEEGEYILPNRYTDYDPIY